MEGRAEYKKEDFDWRPGGCRGQKEGKKEQMHSLDIELESIR